MSTESIEITILGSGTAVPRLDRSSCAFLARAGKSELVFDMGAGTIRRLMEAGSSVTAVTHLFFSHLHPDHTADFVPFVFACKATDIKKDRAPFVVVAGPGFSDFYQGLQNAWDPWLALPPSVMTILEMDPAAPKPVNFGDFSVTCGPAAHTASSVAFRVQAGPGSGGPSIVYTGDTGYTESLVDLAAGCDLLISESAATNDNPVDAHLTPTEAGRIAARAGAKALVLTHFYPECDRVDVAAQCWTTYDGPLFLAADLMRLVVDTETTRVVHD